MTIVTAQVLATSELYRKVQLQDLSGSTLGWFTLIPEIPTKEVIVDKAYAFEVEDHTIVNFFHDLDHNDTPTCEECHGVGSRNVGDCELGVIEPCQACLGIGTYTTL